jgi:hypothetical protein
MAIGIYVGQELKLAIPERILSRFDAAQAELRKKTGREVDLYATTVLSPEHCALWATGLRSMLRTLTVDDRARVAGEQLIAALEGAIAARQSVRIEGE